MSDSSSLNCGSGGGATTYPQLRIAAVFIVLIGSTGGAVFPVFAKRTTLFHVPKGVFDFAKFFGSGVIIATAFIHLLAPGLTELQSPCLSTIWQQYPFALALAMLSIFFIFIIELVAFRWGTSKLEAIGVTHDPHGHGLGAHAAHGPERGTSPTRPDVDSNSDKTRHDLEAAHDHQRLYSSAAAQIIGVFILEFGVLLHSLLIGLTLAVDPDFKVLFVVIIFHQTFEGLGLGSRLAYLQLPSQYNYVPICAAMLYGITTPLGIAIGLGVQSTYNPNSTTASIVSGVLDSLSAGILLYTGLVELLAHEFIFNKEMINASNARIAYAISCMLFGTGIMALLGRWA